MQEDVIVFLSYAREDTKAATKPYNYLKQAGINVLFDKVNILHKKRWKVKIRKKLKNIHDISSFVKDINSISLNGISIYTNILFTDKNYSLNPEMTAGLKGYSFSHFRVSRNNTYLGSSTFNRG